ncbi:MAG: DUF1295 domain-containing protein [Crocinitomicaceae bacterium]
MDLYSQKSKSIPQKIVIITLELIMLWMSYEILFRSGADFMFKYFNIDVNVINTERRFIIYLFCIIIFIRLSFMMLYLLKRTIPWAESVSVPFAFAIYYIGFSLLVMSTDKPLDWIDVLGIIIFLIGSYLNTFGELQRHFWKKRPENKGKLYTEGLFKYSMHINFFGDVLWVTAFAILTRNIYAIIIPIFLACMFIFFNIPALDKYLASHYGEAFQEYKKKTKRFIPFIY